MSSHPPVELAKVDGKLAPADRLARNLVERLPTGQRVLCVVRQPRNLGFHRKAFAMFNLAFKYWSAGKPRDGDVKLSRDRFRKDLIIKAGFFQRELGLDGQVYLEAESLAFDSMDEARFREVYEAIWDVLTEGILAGMTREAAERLAQQVYAEGF